MPIRGDGQKFDAETIRITGLAFEMALVALEHTDGIVNPTRDAVAKKIIERAKAGERDPDRLCDAALQALRPMTPILFRLLPDPMVDKLEPKRAP
jgi:hypothetical protein